MVKIASYMVDGTQRFGLVEGDELHDLPGVSSIAEVAERVAALPSLTGDRRSLDGTRLVAPVAPIRRNPFCVGWNYDAHFAEGKAGRGTGAPDAVPERPTFFTKATDAVIGPNDPVHAHTEVTESLDWEVELAVVIGRGGRDIDEASANDHILGYAVANDVSARNVQQHHGGQWFRGKSLDGTCPIGPWIVTTDEVGALDARTIECRLDGEIVQSALIGDMHFDVARILAELSAGLTLHAGDVILTGTPPGVGNARDPKRFLGIGNVLESEIAGIGVLRNDIVP